METAKQLRDEALIQVEENANAAWSALVLQLIGEIASRLPKVTSDDVWGELKNYPEVQTHQPSAMGAMFRRAASLGLIVPTDSFVLSKRPSSHARPIRIWESKLLQGVTHE